MFLGQHVLAPEVLLGGKLVMRPAPHANVLRGRRPTSDEGLFVMQLERGGGAAAHAPRIDERTAPQQRPSSRSQTALRTAAGTWRELLRRDAAGCSRSGLERASELEDWLRARGAGAESAASEGSGAWRVPFAGSGPMTLEVSVMTELSSAVGLSARSTGDPSVSPRLERSSAAGAPSLPESVAAG